MCASPQRFSTNRITLTSSGFALNLGKFSADAQLHNKCKGYQPTTLNFLQQETQPVG
jgi:hypothetical protein